MGVTFPLTRRERQVLRLCGQGLSPKEVAQRLYISKSSVDFHKYNLFSKLEVGSIMAAVAAVAEIRWPDGYALPEEAKKHDEPV